MQSSIRILCIDDHPLLREGMGAIINCQSDMALAGVAASGKDGIEAYRALQPDITLLDLQLPDINGIDVLMSIRSEFPEANVIILTTFERDVEIQRALKAGARGYMLKSSPPQQILTTIRQVAAGKRASLRNLFRS
ncbi:MAG: response regulator transcription factor [Acidobacteriota bacterium]